MPPLDTTLTEDEQKFFATGELPPSLQPPPTETPPLTPEQQAAATPPVVDPPADPPAPPVNTFNAEAAEILRQSLAEAQQRVGQLEANIQSLQEAQKPQDTPPPDPTTDPLGAMMHQLATVNKAVADLQAQLSQQRELQTQQANFAAFQTQVTTMRDEFTKTTPDFPAALQHLRDNRIADLKFYGLSDADARKTLFQEEVVAAQRAVQAGKNPAEAMYDMAKRHGYTPKAAGTPPTGTPNPAEKLTAIQQAQAASKNLPSTPQLEDITLDGLKGASDADLNKIINDDKLWSKITGADQYPI